MWSFTVDLQLTYDATFHGGYTDLEISHNLTMSEAAYTLTLICEVIRSLKYLSKRELNFVWVLNTFQTILFNPTRDDGESHICKYSL